MKKGLSIVAGLAACAIATAAVAHHSFSMFDPSREEVVRGTVVQWSFNSPHTLLYIEDESGQNWVFEGNAPPSALGRTPSISGDTFTPGEDVVVIHCPLRDGRNGGGVGLVIDSDGTVYNPSDAGCSANQREAEWPEWVEAGYTSKAEAEEATGTGDSQ
ncbi:hypothetical protein HKCCE2091_02980 [Rhodobacterales bacterium HKCCE2091]|nr:hypothetical protein [Rhodobacterales bacterium HKCCE2091]